MLFYAPIALTVISNVFYHIFLKSTPDNVNPIASLMMTYLSAFLIMLMIYPFYPGKPGLWNNLEDLNWVSFALGAAIVGLEVGFLLAYRAGWNISLAGLISNSAVSLLLIPLGLLVFKETLTSINWIGVLFCIVGLMLVNYKA